MLRAHVLVSGRVQGVFFRAECAERARRRGVWGWARNLADGRVEAVFEGHDDAVRFMVDWCHRGPRLAEVDLVETSWEPLAEGVAPSAEGFQARW